MHQMIFVHHTVVVALVHGNAGNKEVHLIINGVMVFNAVHQ